MGFGLIGGFFLNQMLSIVSCWVLSANNASGVISSMKEMKLSRTLTIFGCISNKKGKCGAKKISFEDTYVVCT